MKKKLFIQSWSAIALAVGGGALAAGVTTAANATTTPASSGQSSSSQSSSCVPDTFSLSSADINVLNTLKQSGKFSESVATHNGGTASQTTSVTVTYSGSEPLCTPIEVGIASWSYNYGTVWGGGATAHNQTLQNLSTPQLLQQPGQSVTVTSAAGCGQNDAYVLNAGPSATPGPFLIGPGNPSEPYFISDFANGPDSWYQASSCVVNNPTTPVGTTGSTGTPPVTPPTTPTVPTQSIPTPVVPSVPVPPVGNTGTATPAPTPPPAAAVTTATTPVVTTSVPAASTKSTHPVLRSSTKTVSVPEATKAPITNKTALVTG